MQETEFLQRHKPRMLEITADPSADKVLGSAAIRTYLDALHADFETVDDKPGKRPSLPGEDVFWWSVTILEELAETRPNSAARDPYVLMMLDQLRSMHARLEADEDLPPEFQIHWFDDEDGDARDPELEDAMAELDGDADA